MAVPRVFISSTYYDLMQVRNNIFDFIKSLGYEPIMHERSGVAYTQNEPLEADCYNELSSCDIVVCIIGNHFGTKSLNNELSITMNEINTAIKNKKKVYIFIAKDVYIENRTYEQNKDTGSFKSAYTDDIKIHDFILELKSNVNHVIEPFETTDQIVSTLKLQFAGLFQNLLTRESSLTDAKTAYDLQETSDSIKRVVESFSKEAEHFFQKFDCTVFTSKLALHIIKNHLGIKNFSFFANNEDALDELMDNFGFYSETPDDILSDARKYVRFSDNSTQTLILKEDLFNDDGTLKDIRNRKVIDDLIIWKDVPNICDIDDDEELPF